MSQPIINAGRLTRSDVEADFEELFITYYSRVRALLQRLVGGPEADELTSEVFWRLYNQPAGRSLWNNAGAWLFRTATHIGIDAVRAAARRTHYETTGAAQSGTNHPGPLEEAIRNENCRTVRQVLSTMKPAQAQILLMRSIGASYKEISELLGVAVSSVGTLLNRAEADFKQRYLKVSGRRNDL